MNIISRVKLPYILLFLTALPFVQVAAADDVALIHSQTVTDQELELERGGFTTKDGFVSFGIERAIYINNELQMRTVNDHNLSSILPNDHANSISNVMPDTFTGGLTVVQNNLDNQLIQNVTTINATVANMNIFRQMNLSSMLNQQLVNLMR